MAVNFTSLREAQRKERDNSNTLQPLPPNFYEELAEYFLAKAKAVKDAQSRDSEGSFKDAVAEQHEKELAGARSAFFDLFERRLRKISFMALESAEDGAVVDASSLTQAEKGMFDNLSLHFQAGRKALLSLVFNDNNNNGSGSSNPLQKTTLKNGKIGVRLTGDVPSFVGSDMAPYGPFASGDEAELPEGNAKLLIGKGRAEELKP